MTTPSEPTDLQRGTSALVIARNIRNDIESGKLKHEQQLPSTRALADAWDTSVATINRAMGMLAEEGLVLNRPRSSRLVHYPQPVDNSADTRRPSKVVLIGGYAGSGKTELGRILARSTGWAILDKDTTTRSVVEAALEAVDRSPHDRESDFYLNVLRPAEYDALMAAVSENIECGNSAIVTAPFLRELGDSAWCDRLTAKLRSQGSELVVVWVRCDTDTMRTYIRHRGAARDSYKLADWDRYIETVDLDFEPRIGDDDTYYVVENSAGAPPLQQQAAKLLEVIASP